VTADQEDHIERCILAQSRRMADKYAAGQVEHGGNCYEKPGMLAHALDEVADLAVYLPTLREQLLALADECEQQGHAWIAHRIRYVIHK
jgi:hypothetical protein